MSRKKIAVFASGDGTNAENIIRYFRDADHGLDVTLVVSNRSDAGVLARAEALGVATCVISRDMLADAVHTLGILDAHGVDVVVLAGFLLLIPPYLIDRYSGRMVNIHPSLLPRFGGKGMYGRHVHRAVVEAGERVTGITIHLVSEHYDEGRVLFQASTEVAPADTPDDVAKKVRELEHTHYPRVIADTFM